MIKFLLATMILFSIIFAQQHTTDYVTVDGVPGIMIDQVFIPMDTNQTLTLSDALALYQDAKSEKGFISEIITGIKKGGITFIMANLFFIAAVLLGLIAIICGAMVAVLVFINGITKDKYPKLVNVEDFLTQDFLPKLIQLSRRLFSLKKKVK